MPEHPYEWYPNIPLPTIVPQSFCAVGSNAYSTSVPASAVYILANKAMTYPFVVYKSVTIYKYFVMNGTVVSGNFDVGVYSSDWRKLSSTGATAQAGTSTIQKVTLGTPFVLLPGHYNMAMACDNVTATFFRNNFSSGNQTLGLCREMATAYTLPATITPAAITSGYMPIFGVKLINV